MVIVPRSTHTSAPQRCDAHFGTSQTDEVMITAETLAPVPFLLPLARPRQQP
jgi:hypothetical protein